MDYPTFDPASPETPLREDELAALDAALQALPADAAMTVDGVDGYLCALLAGPPLLDRLKTGEWLPAVWGGDPQPGTSAPFPSNQKKKRTVVLVLRHLRAILAALQRDPAAWEPVFSVAELQDGKSELADAGDWCRGFLAAVDLDPQAWQPLFDDPRAGPALAAVQTLGEDGAEEAGQPGAEGDEEGAMTADDLDDPIVRDRLSRAAAEAVPLLWERRRQAGA